MERTKIDIKDLLLNVLKIKLILMHGWFEMDMQLHIENILKNLYLKKIFAKKQKLGLWAGTFEMPWDYRKKN